MERRQAPLDDSQKIIKKPSIVPPQQQLHHQEPPPRRPVVIYHITSKVVHVDKENFAAIVQNLTGKTPTSSPSTSPPTVDAYHYHGSLSPESRFAAMENANQPSQRPTPSGILSKGPTFLPSITTDFFFPVPTTDPLDLESFDFLLPPPSMADGYWNQERHHQPPMSSTPYGGPLKRHRSDLGHDMRSYLSRDEDTSNTHSVKDTRTIGSAYDLYLQSVQTPSVPSEEVGPFNGVGMGRAGGKNNMMPSELMTGRGGGGGVVPPDFGPHGRAMGFGQQDLVGRPSRELLRLPPDASNTLYVEGLPSNCSRREVAHIFRPFLGYKEVRLVNKDSKQRNGDPIVLCFVDFENPACAATARTALQGYRMDEDEPDSKILQIQFSRNPGPRPGQRGGRR